MEKAELTLKRTRNERSQVQLDASVIIGGRELTIIAGPCAVESKAQMDAVAERLSKGAIHALRGGAFKPRTSPYAFQGHGEEGLSLLAAAGRAANMPIVTEVMSCQQVPLVAKYAHMLQIGSRNMQNFELLKAVGRANKPVLLKRGMAATLEEFIMAAEYILNEGNHQVVLCERGIRSFDSFTRNVLDLGAVVAIKQLTHLPVIVDPSHAAGKRELVADLARAAIACGADGLMIESHPVPEQSVSDARQAISLEDMLELAESLRPIAHAVGRDLKECESKKGRVLQYKPVHTEFASQG